MVCRYPLIIDVSEIVQRARYNWITDIFKNITKQQHARYPLIKIHKINTLNTLKYMYYNTIDDTCIIELLMYEKMYNSVLNIYNWITDWITDVWELVQRHARHPLITVS